MTWYGFLGPETNRRWVVWATSTPSKFVCLLNTFEKIRIHMFLGPDIILTLWSCEISNTLQIYTAFERVWNNVNSYGFSGRRNESKTGPVSYRTPCKFARLVSGSETVWIHLYVILGSEINRRWVLWANRHPINAYAFWAALKQYDLICLSGSRI